MRYAREPQDDPQAFGVLLEESKPCYLEAGNELYFILGTFSSRLFSCSVVYIHSKGSGTVQNVEVTDESGTRQIRDERIELAETGETFRCTVLETAD